MKKSLLATVGFAGALMSWPLPVLFAADFMCTALSSGSTYQNVVVPDNASCALDSATVSGNVSVGKGAVLFLTGERE